MGRFSLLAVALGALLAGSAAAGPSAAGPEVARGLLNDLFSDIDGGSKKGEKADDAKGGGDGSGGGLEKQVHTFGKDVGPDVGPAGDELKQGFDAVGEEMGPAKDALEKIGSSKVSLGKVVGANSLQWLYVDNHVLQGAFGIGAFVAGVSMIKDGEKSFQTLVTAVAAVGTSVSASNKLDEVWQAPAILNTFVSIEAGFFAGLICWHGYAGARYFMGVAIGLMIGYRIHLWIEAHLPSANTDLSAVVLCNLCVFLGLAMFLSRLHKLILAVVAPIVGATLTASAIGFGLTALVHMCHAPLVAKGVPLAAKGLKWVDFFLDLFGLNKHPVGIFDADAPRVGGHPVDVTKWAMTSLVIILAWGGVRHQKKRIRKEWEARQEERKNKYSDDGDFVAAAREPLLEESPEVGV